MTLRTLELLSCCAAGVVSVTTVADPSTATIIAAQKLLRGVKCYNGSLDGNWGDHCRAGMLTYKTMLERGGYIAFFVHRTPVLVIPGDGDGGKTRVFWVGPAQVDGDGPNGNPEHDPCWQPDTTLQSGGHSVDSRKIRGMVVPPQVRAKPQGIVMGCQGWIKNIETGESLDVIVYDEGGEEDDGEISFAATKKVSIPSSPINGGTPRPIMQYEIEPGTAGVQDGVTFNLQRA